MKNKCKAILCSILILTTCTGCAGLFSSPLSLMKPPKASGELLGMEQALVDSVGEDITFIYPETGEYRTPSVTYDFNDDGQDEVLVFYSNNSENNLLNVNLLVKKGDDWKSKSNIKLNGVGVDSVAFADVCKDKNPEIIVGTIQANTKEKYLTIFDFDKNVLSPITQIIYNAYSVCNLLKDDKEQLLIANLSSVTSSVGVPSSRTANAQLISFNNKDNATTVVGSTLLDSSITHIALMQQAPINNDVEAMYIDANIGTSMITELLYYENNQLYSAFYNSIVQSYHQTLREVEVTCKDVDSDGYIEIPQTSKMFGYSDKNSDVQYFYRWRKFDGEKLVDATTTVSPTGDYHLNVDEKWVGNVTLKIDTVQNSCVFYEWDLVTFSIGKRLFSIRIFEKNQWENKSDNNWKKVTQFDDKIYAARVYNKNSNYSMDFDMIKDSLTIID